MAGFNIQDFKSNLKYGGARTSLFSVQITNPANTIADLQTPFFIKAASLPGININPLSVSYFGRPIKLAGNREFEDWNVTVINDEDFKIRNAMEQWSNSINGFETNVRKFPTSEHSQYKSTATITQFSQTGSALRTYKFIGIFPTNIAAIEMDWENESVQNFGVTFSIDYWVVDSSIDNQLAGGI